MLEGEGLPAASALEAAAARASQALPGAAMRLRGWLGGARWVAGPAPVVVEVQAPGWQARDGLGAPFLGRPLSPRGPVLEVLRVPPDRLVLRVLHAAMDGRGLLLWAQALFAALRDEAPQPARGSGRTDLDLVAAFDRKPGPPPPRDALPAIAAPPTPPPHPLWARRSLQGPAAALLPRTLVALATIARWQQPDGFVRIDVPVDLRRHAPELHSTANLTGLVRLPVPPGAQPADLVQALEAALARHEEADFVAAGAAVRGLPLWLLTWAGRQEQRVGRRSGRATTTATVTNLGRVPLASLSGGGFQARSVFVLPPGNPDLPLLLALTGHDHGVELCGVSARGPVAPVLDALHAALTAASDPA